MAERPACPGPALGSVESQLLPIFGWGKGGTNFGLLPKVTWVLSKKQGWDAGPSFVGSRGCGQGLGTEFPNSQGRNTRAAVGGQAERGRGRSGSETPESGREMQGSRRTARPPVAGI